MKPYPRVMKMRISNLTSLEASVQSVEPVISGEQGSVGTDVNTELVQEQMVDIRSAEL
jgi:hypothetical protein